MEKKEKKEAEEKKREITGVRAVRIDTRCGSVGHMTVDEIRARTIGDSVNAACPECGEIHLTPEDVEEARARKITETPKFKKLQAEAEVDKEAGNSS